MNFKPIFYVNGILLLILSAGMVGPELVDLSAGNLDWEVFAASQLVTGFIGFALIFMNRQKIFHMTLKETFLLTSFSWIFLAAFGALPFVFADIHLSYPDAFFEAMSGITDTGSTVITGLDSLPHGILLWRALLHWLGGIGFLTIALVVLPLLQVSGMQLFKSLTLDMEKVLPSANQMGFYICLIYVGLTIICAGLLSFAGMTGFEAICHAMSAISTGGFSTSDASIAHFNSGFIEVILIVFMTLAAMPFVLYLRVAKGDFGGWLKDSQVKAFLSAIGVLTALMTFYLCVTHREPFIEALRSSLFMIVSAISTTGFANKDYTLWGHVVIGIIFMVTFLGGCSGSTAGGIKVFRLEILWDMMHQQLKKLMSPHSITHVHYNKKLVDPSIQASVAGFCFVYIATWLVLGVILQLTGLDFETAFSGAIASISNTGMASMIGNGHTFAALPPESIWTLSLAMLLGRVEFLTFLVILMPRFWRE